MPNSHAIKSNDEGDALTLRVSEAHSKDVGRGCARLDPQDLARLGDCLPIR